MGLFDWLKPKSPTHGPTPEGLYGQLPKGASWPAAQADPAGDPEDFIPESDAYVFDIAEWRWDEQLWIDATTNSAGNLAGFGLVLGLSDGGETAAVEVWRHKGSRGPVKERQEWTIPRGHPTQQLVLVSQGDQTTQVLRKLEQCFGYEPSAHPALPDKTAVFCQLLMLRGIVAPDLGRFTARMKVLLPEKDGWPYGEFFLNVNSVRKQIWVLEKSSVYRAAILNRISRVR